MKYYLLKDYSTGEPWEMLAFKDDVNRSEVQKVIWDSNEYFYEHEDEIMSDPQMNVNCQYEYNLHCLSEKYDFEVIPWSNEDNLYY